MNAKKNIKKSQISNYLILVVILFFIFAFGLFAINKNKFSKYIYQQNEAEITVSEIELYIESCTKDTLIKGIKKFGLKKYVSEAFIENYFLKEFPKCTGEFHEFKEKGYNIKSENLNANITINPETVIVDLKYFSVVTKDGKKYNFDERKYTLDRTVTSIIKKDKETIIISQDGSLIMTLPANTKAILNNKEINLVGIKILDRNFEGNSNRLLTGMIAYEGIPKGTFFSKPIKLVYYYDENNIPYHVNEKDITLGYYDERGFWIGLPGEIDTLENKITIYTTHFTPFGSIISCKPEKTKKSIIVTPPVIQQKCNPCDGWYSQEETPQLYQDSSKVSVDQGIGEVANCIEKEIELQQEKCDAFGAEVTCKSGKCTCLAKVKAYDTPETLYGIGTYQIKLLGNGDSCISGNPSIDSPSIYFEGTSPKDLDKSADINIYPYFCSIGDECIIEPGAGWEKNGNNYQFKFNIKAINKKEYSDACLKSQALILLNGANIKEMYMTCTESQLGQYDFVGMGICSVCTKKGDIEIWIPTDYEKCNSETECAYSLEGKTRLEILETSNNEKETINICKVCRSGKWIQTDISFCNRCINQDGSGVACYNYNKLSEYRKKELQDYAISLKERGVPAAEFMTQMIQFALVQKSTENQKVRELLEVLVGVTDDEPIILDAIAKVFGQDLIDVILKIKSGKGYMYVGQDIASPDDLNPYFNDGTSNQVFHTYYFIALGYHTPILAQIGNYIHESVPWHEGKSVQDYHVSMAGIAIGNALKKGISFSQSLEELGFDDELNQVIDSSNSNYDIPVTLGNLPLIVNQVLGKYQASYSLTT